MAIDPELFRNVAYTIDAILRFNDMHERRAFIVALTKSALVGIAAGILGIIVGLTDFLVEVVKIPVIKAAASFVGAVPLLGLIAQCLGLVYGLYQLYKAFYPNHYPLYSVSLEGKTEAEKAEILANRERHLRKIKIKLSIDLLISIVIIAVAAAALANPVTGPALAAVFIAAGAIKASIFMYEKRAFILESIMHLVDAMKKQAFHTFVKPSIDFLIRLLHGMNIKKTFNLESITESKLTFKKVADNAPKALMPKDKMLVIQDDEKKPQDSIIKLDQHDGIQKDKKQDVQDTSLQRVIEQKFPELTFEHKTKTLEELVSTLEAPHGDEQLYEAQENTASKNEPKPVQLIHAPKKTLIESIFSTVFQVVSTFIFSFFYKSVVPKTSKDEKSKKTDELSFPPEQTIPESARKILDEESLKQTEVPVKKAELSSLESADDAVKENQETRSMKN